MPGVDFSNVANYQVFRDFAASSVKDGTIANVGFDFEKNCSGIVPSLNSDFVGNIRRSKDIAVANNQVRAMFRTMVADMFGGEDKIPASVLDAMKLNDFGKGKPLTARRVRAVFAAIDSAGCWAAGTGKSGSAMIGRLMADSGLDKVENPGEALSQRMCDIAKADLEDHVSTQVEKLVTRGMAGEPDTIRLAQSGTDFDKDVVRLFSNELTVGGEKVSRNPAEAHDAFARLVTGRDDATFAGLDDVSKLKAQILMGCAHQGVLGSAMTGVQIGLDAPGGIGAFSTGKSGSQEFSYSVSREANGDIRFTTVQKDVSPCVMMTNSGVMFIGEDSSYFKYNLSFTIGQKELDAFAKAKLAPFQPTGESGVLVDRKEDGGISGTAAKKVKIEISPVVTFEAHIDQVYEGSERIADRLTTLDLVLAQHE